MSGVRILLVVLLLVAFIGGGIFLYTTTQKKKEDGTLFLLPNDDGRTYRVEARDGKESFKHGRKERMGKDGTAEDAPADILYVPTEISLFQSQFDMGMKLYEECRPEIPCRKVKSDNREDMIWYLQRVHQDVNAVSLDYMMDIPEVANELKSLTLESENPLTIGLGNGDTFVLSPDDSMVEQYLIVLFLYKRLGRPLPKPDPSVDYSYVPKLQYADVVYE